MITRLIEGVPDKTIRVAVGNAAGALTDSILYKDADSTNTDIKNIAQEVLITVEDNILRWAMGVDPENTAGNSDDLGHELGVGKSIMLRGWGQILNFKHINAVSGVVSVIQVTPFFSGK